MFIEGRDLVLTKTLSFLLTHIFIVVIIICVKREDIIIILDYTEISVYHICRGDNMLKEYLKQKNISLYKLSKDTEISYSTINDLVNGVVSVENCRAKMLKRISAYLNMSMDELYDICLNSIYVESDKIDKPIRVTVKNKKYHIDFFYKDENIFIEQEYPVNENTRMYIETIARWDVEDYIDDREMEDILNEISNNEKR